MNHQAAIDSMLPRKTWMYASIPLALYLAYGICFIVSGCTVIEGKTYFFLFDDAFISMRYADNWSQGYGPVWNPGGNPVEGYTSFLWTALLALCHLLPVSHNYLPLLIQIMGLLMGAAVILLIYAAGIAFFRSMFVALTSSTVMACAFPWLYWGVGGMETGLLTLVLTALVFIAYSIERGAENRARDWLAVILFMMGVLIRPEVLLIGLALIWRLYWLRAMWMRTRAPVWSLLIISTYVIYRFCAFRYYGDIFPNTYYVKVGVPLLCRLKVGLQYTGESLCRLWLVILPVLYGLCFQRKQTPITLALPFFTVLIYQIYVGGDSWPRDRFLWPTIPGLLLAGMETIHASLISKFSKHMVQTAGVLIVGLCVLFINLPYGREPLLGEAVYTKTEFRENIRLGLAVKKILSDEGTTAVIWAGASPYYAEKTAIDLLGKSDATIAHQKPRKCGIPGHTKYDWEYSIQERSPDVIERLDHYLGFVGPNAIPGIAEHYVHGTVTVDYQPVELWLRKDGAHIQWNDVQLTSQTLVYPKRR